MAAGQRNGKGRSKAAEKAGPLALSGWVLFDWATQPFYTLVVTFLFAPYFVNGFIQDPTLGATLWAYATGGAELIAALLAPILGSIADAGLRRKPWIAGFSVLLVVGLCGLWLAAPGQTGMAPIVLLFFGLAIIGAELATVFNNAMMPSLVSHKRLGMLSGIGWAAGYVGGLVSLVLVAGFIIADPDTGKTLLGFNPIVPVDMATRADERLVGPLSALWYLIFVLPLFLFTPDRPGSRAAAPVKAGMAHLIGGVKELYRHHRQVALFLIARMLYADGLGAIFAFGGIYAASVFGWGASELGLFGIILTLAGTIGAASGGVLDDRLGSKHMIGWALCLFILASIGVLSVDKNSCAVRASGRAEGAWQRAVLFHGRADLSRLRHSHRPCLRPDPGCEPHPTRKDDAAGEDHRVLRLLLVLRQDHRVCRTARHRNRHRRHGQSAPRHRHEPRVPRRRAAPASAREALHLRAARSPAARRPPGPRVGCFPANAQSAPRGGSDSERDRNISGKRPNSQDGRA